MSNGRSRQGLRRKNEIEAYKDENRLLRAGIADLEKLYLDAKQTIAELTARLGKVRLDMNT